MILYKLPKHQTLSLVKIVNCIEWLKEDCEYQILNIIVSNQVGKYHSNNSTVTAAVFGND